MTPGHNQYVAPEGLMEAEILVIGEFPWLDEIHMGRPFAGQAGGLLERWWRPLSLFRRDIRTMYLYPFKPPVKEIESIPTAELLPWLVGLPERVAEMPNLKVIVPLGNYATFALTGKGKVRAAIRKEFGGTDKVSEAEKKAGITQLRGSVYDYTDLNGRQVKVIPSIHPDSVQMNPKWEKRCVWDWHKIIQGARKGFGEFERKHVIDPDEDQIIAYVKMVEEAGAGIAMAIDIESWGGRINCVGFAVSPRESFTISLEGRNRDYFWPYVKRLCESDAQKILCNGTYDWYWLGWEGIWLKNFYWDVQLMHHALDPGDNHSLDYLASLYCSGYRYWKDEAKDAEEVIKYADNLEALWVYNGLDCCYTRELLDHLYVELVQEKMLEFYLKHYQEMIEPLLRTMLHGIRIDKEKQKKWAKVLRKELKEIHRDLNEAAGKELFATEEVTKWREPTTEEWGKLLTGSEEIKDKDNPPAAKYINREERKKMLDKDITYMIGGQNAGQIRYKVTKLKKDFSKAKIAEFFHVTLALPVQYKFRKGKKGRQRTESLDEGAIRNLTKKYPSKIKNWGNLLLAYREKKKELDYLKGSYDSDGRMRCSYKMITEAGRLASAKNPKRSGMNLQNIKR